MNVKTDVKIENNELFVRLINEHWIKYVQPFFIAFLLIALSLALLYFWFLGQQKEIRFLDPLYLIILLLVFLVHHWTFLFLFSEEADGIVLTNRRLIHFQQRLYLFESMQDITYNQIKSVRVDTTGLLHNILRYGNLAIDPGVFIPLVPHPNKVGKEIEQLMGMR